MLMNNYIHPLQHQALKKPLSNPSNKHANGNALNKMLHRVSKGNVDVSKHAGEGLTERDVEVNVATGRLIENKMHAAKREGIPDLLVMTDEAALVVSTNH